MTSNFFSFVKSLYSFTFGHTWCAASELTTAADIGFFFFQYKSLLLFFKISCCLCITVFSFDKTSNLILTNFCLTNCVVSVKSKFDCILSCLVSSFSLITQKNVLYGLFATLLFWHAGNRMGENSWGAKLIKNMCGDLKTVQSTQWKRNYTWLR